MQKERAIKYIEELTKQGFSASYIVTKAYYVYGNDKVKLKFILDQVEIARKELFNT